jgi:hypothetical protein
MFLNFWNEKQLPTIEMPDPGEHVATPASAASDAFTGPSTPRNASTRKRPRTEPAPAKTLFD